MLHLKSLLKTAKKRKLLAVFPHPDDESFVAGGLFQLAKELGIETSLICLTGGAKKNQSKKRKQELEKACEVIGIENLYLWDYVEGELKSKATSWLARIKKVLLLKKPDFLLTFDHSGITGHPDHIVVSVEMIKLIKNLKTQKPKVLFRVPDQVEREHFKTNQSLVLADDPTHIVSLSFNHSLRKIKAIFAHQSQMPSLLFKLQILDWYLFDHEEPYHLLNFKNKKRTKIIIK